MKKVLAFVLALALAPAFAPAQVACFGYNVRVVTSGFEKITVSTAEKNLTPTADATLAVLTVETSDIRWRVDGTSVTDTIGHLLAAGSSMVICGEQSLARFSTMRDPAASADAVISITYYKAG